MKKDWYKSKTLWLATLQGISGIVTVLVSENPQLDAVGGVAVLKSVLDVALRLITVKEIK